MVSQMKVASNVIAIKAGQRDLSAINMASVHVMIMLKDAVVTVARKTNMIVTMAV